MRIWGINEAFSHFMACILFCSSSSFLPLVQRFAQHHLQRQNGEAITFAIPPTELFTRPESQKK